MVGVRVREPKDTPRDASRALLAHRPDVARVYAWTMLQAIDLCVAHVPGRLVLDGVSHAFAPGAVTVVLGPNGAGKSTLLRTLMGSLTPARGRVLLGDQRVHEMRPADRARRLAFIPQRSEAIFAYSLAEMVAMGNGRAGRSDVDSALERVGLAPLALASFGSLSGGQQQRGLVARALVQLGDVDPARCVLLADEPVASMDPRHAVETMRLLAELASRGVTVVAVLHDLSLATAFATHAVLIDAGGRMAGAGRADDLLDGERIGRLYDAPFRRIDTPGGRVLVVDVASEAIAQGAARGARS